MRLARSSVEDAGFVEQAHREAMIAAADPATREVHDFIEAVTDYDRGGEA